MKKIVLIVLGVALVAAFVCTQIIDTKELRFTTKFADGTKYSVPLPEEEYTQMETLGVEFNAKFSKRLLGGAKMEGEITLDGKIYKILEIQRSGDEWFIVLWNEDDPYWKCSYLRADLALDRFYLTHQDTVWFGPAETSEELIGALRGFGRYWRESEGNFEYF